MDSLGCLPVSSLELMRQLAIMLYPTLHIPGLYCTIKHPPIWPIKNKKKTTMLRASKDMDQSLFIYCASGSIH